MTNTAQKALIEKLDAIIESLAELTTLLEASFDTQPEIEADPLADHPELPLGNETEEAEIRWQALPEIKPAPHIETTARESLPLESGSSHRSYLHAALD